MERSDQSGRSPLVSVVTPFFNSADFLDDCIKSVRSQTYQEIEYVIVDNCSTDASAKIVRQHVGLDRRIRFYTNERHLDQVSNYNQALRKISPNSEFCVIAQADDALAPNHISSLIKVAIEDDSVGIVTSYWLEGDRIQGGPVSRRATVLDGKEVCRLALKERIFVFGPPTTFLYRAAIIRSKEEFFDPSRLHEDTDILIEILKDWNLGFVHEVLSFVRFGNPSITSKVSRFDPYKLDHFIRVWSYADDFLDPIEASRIRKRAESEYLSYLASRSLLGSSRGLWRYHKSGLDTIGYSIPFGKLTAFIAKEILNLLGNPKNTIMQFFSIWKKNFVNSDEVDRP